MESIKILCILIVGLKLLIQTNCVIQEESIFRLTRNAMVPVNKQTDSSLISAISSLSGHVKSKLSCLSACNLNQNCDIVSFDMSENVCRLYMKTTFLNVSRITDSTKFIYDKFIDNLWSYCDESADYTINPLTGLCYYFNQNLFLNWTQARDYCDSMGLTLLIVDTPEKLILAQNLTAEANKYIWVGSSTTVAKNFTWLDGSPINTSFWGSGQPDNAGYSYLFEACIMVFVGNYLNDAQCASPMAFVCQLQ